MTAALIHELFEQQARLHPGRTAVVCESRSLTYAQVDRLANQLARQLRDRGVGPDERVVLCLERSVDLLVAILGILKAGGAYVPVEPGSPVARLSYVLRDAMPRVWLTQRKFADLLPLPANVPCVMVDAMERRSDECINAREFGLEHRHLAYVIYTSGSTGEPKGVMVEHRNVVNLWHALRPLYSHAHPDGCRRVGVNASIAFDSSVKQLVQVLSGSTLYILSQSLRGHARALLTYLDEQRIDAIDCTPSQLRKWLAAGFMDRFTGALRTVLVGGEAIDAHLWSKLARYPEVAFFNVYGPTECTVDTTAALIDQGPPHIGRPLSNVQVHLLDDQHRQVSGEEVGEIGIGGLGVSRGYLNRPQLTAERFVPDPFSDGSQARIYMSGDMGRRRAGGEIEYLGRRDHQIKIRGFRVELGEIEVQLMRHGSLREAVVVARENGAGEQRLIAYVTLSDRCSDGTSELVRSLRMSMQRLLPDYMIPSSFVVLDRLPLTPNGKIDRNALSARQPAVQVASPVEVI
jgi:amino acid adenylation domain-containing protein